MRRCYVVALVLQVFLTMACASSGEVGDLRAKTAELEQEILLLKTSVETLEQSARLDKAFSSLEANAFLTPGSDGYSVIQTDLGRVTVELSNVQPYANGSRVTLRFGNLLSATINGVKAKLEWGNVDETFLPKHDNAKMKDMTFGESLRAGEWTNVQVVLEGVPPTELGFVRVWDLTHTGITLHR